MLVCFTARNNNNYIFKVLTFNFSLYEKDLRFVYGYVHVCMRNS